jgi:hypothetical protein
MTPYKQYGVYRHPADGVESVLSADDLDRAYYERKGFEFVRPATAPGTTAGPRDIDRDDSGQPKGPDGSTHDRHPGEVTPDMQPVPWGFPLLGVKGVDETARTAAAAKGMRGARGAAKVELAAPEDELRRLDQQATLPGRLVEQGVTRGLRGVDPTMPSPIPGIPLSDREGIRAAVARGELELEPYEVAPGETVMRLVRAGGDAPVRDVPGPTDAPGGGTREGAAREREATNEQDARQAEARRAGAKREARAESRPAEKAGE